MAKINVELNAFYGYGCGRCGYGSNENIEIEVSDIELEALRKIGSDKISCKEIVSTIENGDTTLQSLHEQLEEKYYYMVEEYWLYEAYNECLYESLEEHIDQDIKDGLFIPGISLYEDESDYPNYANNEEEEESDEEEDDEYEYEEDEEESDDINNYNLDEYYDWVKRHDHEFAAERVGLDLDACRDDEVDYTIHLA